MVHHWGEIVKGYIALITSAASWFFTNIYPTMMVVSSFLGFILVIHGTYELITNFIRKDK